LPTKLNQQLANTANLALAQAQAQATGLIAGKPIIDTASLANAMSTPNQLLLHTGDARAAGAVQGQNVAMGLRQNARRGTCRFESAKAGPMPPLRTTRSPLARRLSMHHRWRRHRAEHVELDGAQCCEDAIAAAMTAQSTDTSYLWPARHEAGSAATQPAPMAHGSV